MSISGEMDLVDYIYRQRDWSSKTFGQGQRTEGLCKHIEKELAEIRQAPGDITEPIDVIILALELAWRAGHSPEEIVHALQVKQEVNFKREWNVTGEDTPSEHKREVTCPNCKNVIDPDTCQCGEEIDGNSHDAHYPIPMGCTCHKAD